MLTIQSDHSAKVVLETGSGRAWTVAFHPDGIHVFGGTGEGIQRWRLADGEEVGKQTWMDLNAISVSMDEKWVVCGSDGASVWDAEIREMFIEVEGTTFVSAVDIAPDCTRFATGNNNWAASIWSIATGERLVGPLEHGNPVVGVKFSPDGQRFATASSEGSEASAESSIRIFDSDNGDQLVYIKNPVPRMDPVTPIVWSMDSQKLFATSEGSKIKSFDSTTGSELAEWKIHDDDHPERFSIALSANNKFIAACASRSVSFWDTSTHTQIGIVTVEDTEQLQCIALSPDGSRLAGGSYTSGRVNVWDLHSILPDSYLPVKASRFLSSRIRFIHHMQNLFGPQPRMQVVIVILRNRRPVTKKTMTLSSRYNEYSSFLGDTSLTVLAGRIVTEHACAIIRL